jgi:hypothetical protein
MSFYATINGQITYPDKEAYDKACKLLGMGEKGGWVDKNGYFVDECGNRFFDDPDPDCSPVHLSIIIPVGHYRNLSRLLDALTENTKSEVVWTSTDGCFSVGIIENGVETTYRLDERAKENLEFDDRGDLLLDNYREI